MVVIKQKRIAHVGHVVHIEMKTKKLQVLHVLHVKNWCCVVGLCVLMPNH